MIQITINSSPVGWANITYHFQSLPRPGGAHYIIEISRDEREIIGYLERMVERKVDDPGFSAAAASHNATTYNLVQYVLWKLEEQLKQEVGRPLWVLNNIKRVIVKAETITIEGEGSPAVGHFETARKA